MPQYCPEISGTGHYVHIDISEPRLAGGKLNMVLAIDRVSKFIYVEFRDNAGKINNAEFLRGVV